MNKMMIRLYSLFTILISFSVLQAQKSGAIYEQVMEMQKDFPASSTQIFSSASQQSPIHAETYVKKAEFFQLKTDFFTQTRAKKPNTLFLAVPFEGKIFKVQLFKKEVTTATYTVKAASGKNVAQNQSVFYRGVLENKPNSLASLSLTSLGLRMTLSDGSGNIEINRIDKNLYAAYRVSDSNHKQEMGCTAEETDYFGKTGISHSSIERSSAGECIEVYIECDFDSFNKNGGSVQNTEDWALSLMNEVGILYDNAGIPMFVSDILVYDQPDPYTAGGNAGQVLGMMGSVIGNDYEGRLAHVFSTRGLGGGVAYVNVLCAFNSGGAFGPYAVSGSMNSSTIPFPIYSWNVMVVAHELGHNVGSLHTHNCVWNGNNTQIDDCGNSATNQGNNSPCYDENNPILPNAGSIMSYCHLIGSIGIDFNIGFHPQVADLMFDRYISAPCVTGEGCSGGEPPIADFTYTQSDLCNPATVQFTDLSLNNPSSYLWFFPGGNPQTSTDPNPFVEYVDPGFFDVSLTVTNFAGEDELYLSQIIEIIETPDPDFDYEIEDGVMKFTNQTTGPVDINFWDFGDGSASTDVNPCYAFEQDGSYLVTLTVESICGVFEIEHYVDFFTPPTAGFAADADVGCLPQVINFTNQSSENSEDFLWMFEGGNPETSTEENPAVEYDSAGVFEVTLVVTNDQGEDSLVMMDYITIKDIPSVVFEYEMDSLAVTFTNQSESYDILSWNFGDGSTSTNQNPTHTYEEEGTYDVTLTVSNICDTMTMTQTIVLSSLPTANYTANKTSGCLPLSVEFTNASSTNADTWEWTFEGGSPASSTEEHPVVTYSEAGTFDVVLIVSNESGTDTMEELSLITVGDIPTAAFNVNITDLEANFTDSSIGYDSLHWDFGDGNDSNETNPTHNYSEDGIYEVVLTTFNECGSNTSTQSITASTLPTAGFSANIVQDCVPLTVEFSNSSSSNAIDFDWSFPGGAPASSTEENPVITYEEKGSFNVSLIVSSLAGKDTMLMEDYIVTLDVPSADFGYANTDDFEITFTNLSTDANSYVWDFGDGMTSSEENPVHIYGETGTYTVILTSKNNCGEETYEVEVTVSDITSTDEFDLLSDVKVFPNPNEGTFEVSIQAQESTEVEMEIFNTLGQSVLKDKFRINGGINNRNVDMEDSASGVYLLVLRRSEERRVVRVFVN